MIASPPHSIQLDRVCSRSMLPPCGFRRIQTVAGEVAMMTYDDCLGLSVLRSEEIAAIAKHEHVPDIIALEMGSCLCETPEGKQLIRRMIFDDIEDACRRGDTRTAGKLGLVLHRFI